MPFFFNYRSNLSKMLFTMKGQIDQKSHKLLFKALVAAITLHEAIDGLLEVDEITEAYKDEIFDATSAVGGVMEQLQTLLGASIANQIYRSNDRSQLSISL